MALTITTNGQNVPSGEHAIVNLKTGYGKITFDFVVTNTGVSGGTNGTTYAVSTKTKSATSWSILETYPGSATQVTGTLAATNVDVTSSVTFGSDSQPLDDNMMYRLEISNDNGAGDTLVELSPSVSKVDESVSVFYSYPHHLVFSQNTNVENWTFTGYPDYATMGMTKVDLSATDPNFPKVPVRFAIVQVIGGLRSNGANIADVVSNIGVTSVADNGTDVDVNSFWTTNLKGRIGEINEVEDQMNQYIRLNENNEIIYGVNTLEEAGSSAFGTINIVGYAK